MVDREIEGSVWVLGRSWSICVQPLVALGAYVVGRGAVLGSMLAIVGRSCGSAGGLVPPLGLLCVVLGRSRGLCVRSWFALGSLRAVLGRPCGRCMRSWVALGAYVGGLGAVSGVMLAILGCTWGLCG